MPRVTVWVSDELLDAAMAKAPGLKKSEAFQAGLRAIAACDHEELRCACCGETVTADGIAGPRLTHLFESTMRRLRERISSPGYEGAARLVRQVAADHGVPGVLATPVPRPTRAQLARRDVVELPVEADSRRRHPTAKEATA